MVTTTPAPRVLPLVAKRGTECDRCGRVIVWARTSAGPNGPGGKAIPLDPVEDFGGSYAVVHVHHGVLVARPLGRDETPDRPSEYAAMPHAATCRTPRGGW